MKIVSIVGARPEFIQGSPVSRALRPHHQEILIHTGQHYDYKMSQAFFDELEIPAPNYNLEVGSGQHGQQTAQILSRLEEVLLQEQPDLVIIRGDTNSTLAGAIAASKLHIPLAHIEAGERSYDRRMPEEINRVVSDSISNMHFCVSKAAIHNLAKEGVTDCVHWVGDVMYDAMIFNRPIAYRNSNMVESLGLERGGYALVTVHRAANTDDPIRLGQIVNILNNAPEPVVFPAHPRTRKALTHLGAAFAPHVCVIDPVSYFDMIVLEDNARLIATDSGGVQREAYFLGKPCLTLRDETEWTETVTTGWNRLMPLELNTVLEAWQNFTPPTEQPPIFGDGKAGEKIARLIEEIMN